MVVCGGVWWFAVVCGGLRWFVVDCGGLSFSHTLRVGCGVHDSYTFQCGLVPVGSFTSPGMP